MFVIAKTIELILKLPVAMRHPGASSGGRSTYLPDRSSWRSAIARFIADRG